MWQDVRDHDHGKLLFRYDPLHHLVQIGSRGVIHVVDLTVYRPVSVPTPPHQSSETDK